MLGSVAGSRRRQTSLLDQYSSPLPLGNGSDFHSCDCLADSRLDLRLNAGRCLCSCNRLLHSHPHAGLCMAAAPREWSNKRLTRHSYQAIAGYLEVQRQP